MGQSETFTDTPTPNTHLAPPPPPPFLRSVPDTLPSEPRILRVESEIFADKPNPNTPAHRPASDF